jgi:hypothetical protein
MGSIEVILEWFFRALLHVQSPSKEPWVLNSKADSSATTYNTLIRCLEDSSRCRRVQDMGSSRRINPVGLAYRWPIEALVIPGPLEIGCKLGGDVTTDERNSHHHPLAIHE